MQKDFDINKTLNKVTSDERKRNLVYISLSAVVVLLLLSFSVLAPFKDKINQLFFPKPSSHAAGTTCTETSNQVPDIKYGYAGPDATNVHKLLNTPLAVDYGYSTNKYIQMVNHLGPNGILLLMDGGLLNVDFDYVDGKGMVGQPGQLPQHWGLWDGGTGGSAVLDGSVQSPGDQIPNIVKVHNGSGGVGTQIGQTFSRTVTPGQYAVFGTFVYTSDPAHFRVFLQNTLPPYQEFGSFSNSVAIPANKWIFVQGYGQVPDGVNKFNLVLRVGQGEGGATAPNVTAWFDQAEAALIDTVNSTDVADNQQIHDIVTAKCGSDWLAGNEEGFETFTEPNYILPTYDSSMYALTYHQYYWLIKKYDPQAKVLMGGLADTTGPAWITSCPGQYCSGSFMANWAADYHKFFGQNQDPPMDAASLHYYEGNSNLLLPPDPSKIDESADFHTYLTNVRSYLDSSSGIPSWKGLPIWVTEFGAVKCVGGGKICTPPSNNGVDFMTDSLTFLKSVNSLNIQKWFWFGACFNGYSVVDLTTGGGCPDNSALSPVGVVYANQRATVNVSIQADIWDYTNPTPVFVRTYTAFGSSDDKSGSTHSSQFTISPGLHWKAAIILRSVDSTGTFNNVSLVRSIGLSKPMHWSNNILSSSSWSPPVSSFPVTIQPGNQIVQWVDLYNPLGLDSITYQLSGTATFAPK